MTRYRLIGFDMDGTILNSKKQISPATLEAVKKAVQAGFHVILSTGRGISELADYREILSPVRYYVCESGALVYDSRENRILHSETLPEKALEEIFALTAPLDVMPYLMSCGESYASPEDIKNSRHFHMGTYQEMMERITRKVDSVAEFYMKTKAPAEKLNLYSATPQIRKEIYSAIQHLPVTAAFAETTSLELSPAGISKASGLTWLCSYLGLSQEQTIIVGDADNDIEAMKAAGLSVAMGNAREHIKAICDVTVSDNDHDGCAQAIYEYLMH